MSWYIFSELLNFFFHFLCPVSCRVECSDVSFLLFAIYKYIYCIIFIIHTFKKSGIR